MGLFWITSPTHLNQSYSLLSYLNMRYTLFLDTVEIGSTMALLYTPVHCVPCCLALGRFKQLGLQDYRPRLYSLRQLVRHLFSAGLPYTGDSELKPTTNSGNESVIFTIGIIHKKRSRLQAQPGICLRDGGGSGRTPEARNSRAKAETERGSWQRVFWTHQLHQESKKRFQWPQMLFSLFLVSRFDSVVDGLPILDS